MWMLEHLPEQHWALMKHPELTPAHLAGAPRHPPELQAQTHREPCTCGVHRPGQCLPAHGFLDTQTHRSHCGCGRQRFDGLQWRPAHGFALQPAKLRDFAPRKATPLPASSCTALSRSSLASDAFTGSGASSAWSAGSGASLSSSSPPAAAAAAPATAATRLGGGRTCGSTAAGVASSGTEEGDLARSPSSAMAQMPTTAAQ
mmetsp:Transcript_122759/g.308830  ORF Transcript_122759/g.308830 Transcript_122759/m.308830 type:complete len:202 (-) Transcript_122759:97-702(-)